MQQPVVPTVDPVQSKTAVAAATVKTEPTPASAPEREPKRPQLQVYNAPTLVMPSVRPVHAVGKGMAENVPLELQAMVPVRKRQKDSQQPLVGEKERQSDTVRDPLSRGGEGDGQLPSRTMPAPASDEKEQRGRIPSGRKQPPPPRIVTEDPIRLPGPSQPASRTPVPPSDPAHRPPESPPWTPSSPKRHIPGLPSRSSRITDPFADIPPSPGTVSSPVPVHNPFSDDTEGLLHGTQPDTDDDDDEDAVPEPASPVRSRETTRSRHGRATIVEPIPAATVFAADAKPLHLPMLEEYLSNKTLFDEPFFSDARVLCTETERALYGYDTDDGGDQDGAGDQKKKKKRSKRGKGRYLEAAGGQFAIPKAALRAGAKPRARTNEEEQEEKVLLSDQMRDEPQRPNMTRNSTSDTSVPTVSLGIPSNLSTATTPLTRQEMFPPMMLLKDTGLRELKSNAVGPRAPPGGLFAYPLGSLLGTIIDFTIGMEGSSFAASLISLELLRDFAQIMANNLHFTTSPYVTQDSSAATQFIFLTLPNFLALDFVSVFGKAVIFFGVWIALTSLALIKFYRMTSAYDPNREVEGYDSQPYLFTSPARGTKVVNILVVFLLTGLYIPLTKLSIDALTWSSAWWVIPNPYIDSPDQTPILPSLGDPHLYREPLDFCWTTTMRKDQFNFAWLILPAAALVIIFYTLWFPLRMALVIKDLLPNVSRYNELGNRRSKAEMEAEYYVLLGRDKSPLNFMYNAYRRQMGYCECWLPQRKKRNGS